MDIQFGNKTLDPNNLFQYLMYSMNWVGFSQDANNLTVAPPSYYGMQLTYVQGQSQTFYALEKHIVGNMLHWIGWYMTGAETFAECTGTITNFGKPYASFTIKANPTPSSIVQVSKARRAVGEPVNYDDSVKVHLGRGWHSLNATESAVVRNLITWCGCEALYTWFWVGIGSKEFTSQAFGYNLGVMLEASDWKTNFQASQGLIGLTELMNWEVAQPTFTKVDGHIYVNGTKLINMSVGECNNNGTSNWI